MNGLRSSVGVIVPARDERDTIDACVRSIRAAIASSGAPGWIVVVADDCSDDTAARARSAVGHDGEVIERSVRTLGSVGAARRDGCARALHYFRRCPPVEVVLLSTDADSLVGADWVSARLADVGCGAAAVAGSIVVDSFAGRHPRLRARFERVYASGRSDEHPHVHGANLAVRADAYLAVGGFRAMATGEEHDLWARLQSAGYAITSTMAAPVVTSGRRFGRAPAGFASYLNALERVGHEASA